MQGNARLVAFVSLRSYFGSRRKIKAMWHRSTVLPMVPGIGRWRWNAPLLRLALLFSRKRAVLARNPFAACLALRMPRRFTHIIYDGRGAVHAEWVEYKLSADEALVQSLGDMERTAVLHSDRQLAVSQALITHWQREFQWKGETASVIPCTLNSGYDHRLMSWGERKAARAAAGISEHDILLVYSGGDAGWQSQTLLESALTEWMRENQNVKVMLLSRMNELAARLQSQFPARVLCEWHSPQEAFRRSQLGDVALLLREETLTNVVASPSKMGEYLSAGLPVAISPGVGDFTTFVRRMQCGWVHPDERPQLQPLTEQARNHSASLAEQHFQKKNFAQIYLDLATPGL